MFQSASGPKTGGYSSIVGSSIVPSKFQSASGPKTGGYHRQRT